MRNGFRFHHVLMGTLGAMACAFAVVRGADPKYKTYEIPTADGVRLAGNLWSNSGAAAKKDATVILLHDFGGEKGGSSRDAGWDDLGDKLLDAGYSVLSFDFRGFGDSTKVDPKVFWDGAKCPHNHLLKNWGKTPLPEAIHHGEFERAYYPYLVNDLIAVKTWLDGRNDAGDVNTSSVFVIGAGQGATIGALWMDTEWHLQKASLDPLTNQIRRDPKTLRFILQDPEGGDQAGAIWLSISPTLADRSVSTSLHNWLGEVGGANRVPMAFFYGAKEGKEGKEGKDFAGSCLKAINSGYRRANGAGSLPETEVTEKMEESPKHSEWKLPDTLKIKIGDDTTLSGSKLLSDDLPTAKYILLGLNKIMGDRKNLVSKQRRDDGAAFFWTFGNNSLPIRGKEPMDPTPPLFDPQIEPRLMR